MAGDDGSKKKSKRSSESPAKTKEGKPKQGQYSISSFLPKFAASSSSASTSAATTKSKGLSPPAKKRKVTFEEEDSAKSSPIRQAESSSPDKKKRQSTSAHGKGKANADLIDLTLSDDEGDESAGEDTGAAMWADQYAPKDKTELGLHPKKLEDVQNWLTDAFNPKLSKYRRLLILSGPSGAGKTATIQVLANELDFDILHYRAPSNFAFAGDIGRESIVNHLSNFLSRAGMAPALSLVSETAPAPVASTSAAAAKPDTFLAPYSKTKPQRKRLIVIEDLPNVSHFQTREALRAALLQYLASPRVTCPLVLIISDALSTRGRDNDADNASYAGRIDNVDARSVCGLEVLNAVGAHHISFNPVAPTIMKKALLPILDRVYEGSKAPRPSTQVVDLIIANSGGDIRSALMSLQFVASNPDSLRKLRLAEPAADGKGKKKKAASSRVGAASDSTKEVLSFVSSRESTLVLFHALGKVLYNKRWGDDEKDDKKDKGRSGILQPREFDDPDDAKLHKLPKHLKQHRREPSKVDTDTIFAEVPVDSDVFLTYLEHNFPQFTDDVDECSAILDCISAADSVMRLDYESAQGRAALSSQYSFNLAVRGTLFHLPRPVPRRKQTLRKSQLWESTRLASDNDESIRALYRGRLDAAFASTDVDEAVAVREVGIANQRSRRAVCTETIPYLGLIRPNVTSGPAAFVTQLATFPDLQTLEGGYVRGEALDEKEAVLEDGLRMDLDNEQPNATASQSRPIETGPAQDEQQNGAEKEELLYDPMDDIDMPD